MYTVRKGSQPRRKTVTYFISKMLRFGRHTSDAYTCSIHTSDFCDGEMDLGTIAAERPEMRQPERKDPEDGEALTKLGKHWAPMAPPRCHMLQSPSLSYLLRTSIEDEHRSAKTGLDHYLSWLVPEGWCSMRQQFSMGAVAVHQSDFHYASFKRCLASPRRRI